MATWRLDPASGTRQESGSDLAAVRQDLTRIVRDLKAAYDAMNEVVRRSHGE